MKRVLTLTAVLLAMCATLPVLSLGDSDHSARAEVFAEESGSHGFQCGANDLSAPTVGFVRFQRVSSDTISVNYHLNDPGLAGASMQVALEACDGGRGYWPLGQVHVDNNGVGHLNVTVTIPTADTGDTQFFVYRPHSHSGDFPSAMVTLAP